MEKLLILIAFPIIWPFVAKRIWDQEVNWTEMTINIIVVVLLSVAVWQLGKYGKTQDTEIWNGYVIDKNRKHGHYLKSYQCNCSTTCSGSGSNEVCRESCSTCYEDHYTVTWTAETSVGDVRFDHKDSRWRSVYNSPDPASYIRCIIGEPASLEHGYTNYVQAVPQSLFSGDRNVSEEFRDKIPEYPRVFDFYRIIRVLNIDSKVPTQIRKTLNDDLGTALKIMGAQKQVNIIVILTEIDDPSYRYKIENAWLGGKKNDVVVFIGLDELKITWADVMTWALNKNNEFFHVKMRDRIKELGILDPKTLVPAVTRLVNAHFDRPKMAEFEYLAEEVEPPLWVIVLAVIIAIGGSIGLSVYFRHDEAEDYIGNAFRNLKRR
ncbi:hypothetical protein L0Y49_02680 [bacterium]|nr:hypothetical protein [bacterium]MCI0566275.1 hypothetical protein [bacterium]